MLRAPGQAIAPDMHIPQAQTQVPSDMPTAIMLTLTAHGTLLTSPLASRLCNRTALVRA